MGLVALVFSRFATGHIAVSPGLASFSLVSESASRVRPARPPPA